MKSIAKTIQANIDNLTSLWRAVSKPFNAIHTMPDYEYSYIKDSSWPNRIWLKPATKPLTPELLEKIQIQLASIPTTLRFPRFDTPTNPITTNENQLLQANGFALLFDQIGMTLELTHDYEVDTNLDIIHITTEAQAKQWTDIYPSSFDHYIHPKILLAAKGVDFYLATLNNQPIGTALLYTQPQQKVSGFHCLGIIPSARRCGHAEQLMRYLLNIAINQGSRYATLQASPLGQKIYQRLGFQSQFTLKNYALTNG